MKYPGRAREERVIGNDHACCIGTLNNDNAIDTTHAPKVFFSLKTASWRVQRH